MSSEDRLTLRQEQQAETRRRLLKAARAAFFSGGFTGTTVDSIAAAANTSRATFYLHFKNKTDALLATWSEVDLPEVDALFRRYDDAGDFSEPAARRWVASIVEYWEHHGLVGRTALQALALEPELDASWVANMTRAADDMPRLHVAMGGDDLAHALLLTNIIQLERVLYFWSNDDLSIDRDALITALARHWTVA